MISIQALVCLYLCLYLCLHVACYIHTCKPHQLLHIDTSSPHISHIHTHTRSVTFTRMHHTSTHVHSPTHSTSTHICTSTHQSFHTHTHTCSVTPTCMFSHPHMYAQSPPHMYVHTHMSVQSKFENKRFIRRFFSSIAGGISATDALNLRCV